MDWENKIFRKGECEYPSLIGEENAPPHLHHRAFIGSRAILSKSIHVPSYSRQMGSYQNVLFFIFPNSQLLTFP